MLLYNHICEINITEDNTYTVDSEDNKSYDIIMNPRNYKHNDRYKAFAIYIDLFCRQISIILIGSIYAQDTDCAVLEENILTVLQNDTIVQINIEDASVINYKQFECVGCNYGIYKVKQGYLVHGEIEIIMLTDEFNEIWSFFGRDIFMSLEVCENSIKLTDFENNYYEIDFNGRELA